SAKPWELIEADILEAKKAGPRFRRAFLCDGDALILGAAKLVRILGSIREHLPWVERVGVYGDTRSVGKKSVDELRQLCELGLGIVYHGVESGSDEVLRLIDKGGTRDQCADTARKLRESGIAHSVMVLLGVGGTRLSEEHARDTASLLTEMDPPYVGALTTTVVPGTPLAAAQAGGDFVLPDKFRMLEELQVIVKDSHFSQCRFSANHASNYLPLTCELPRERDELLGILQGVLQRRDERVLKPELLRGL
ncbi:MAG TPA: radical SAM protein, partial [Polyangiaceae bacterium]|nr:radical SAM protein [Polyangiaceae bacterium]